MEVYCITNLVNNKKYIGITSTTTDARYRRHLNKAKNGSMNAIHCAIRKYGEKSFKVETLRNCDSWDNLCDTEVKLISEYNTFVPNGYNMTYGGEGVLGVKRIKSEEERANHSQKMKGHAVSEETRRKIGDAHRGKKPPKEQLEALIKFNTGRKDSQEAIERKRIAATGRLHTQEAKNKMSEMAKKRTHNNLLDMDVIAKREETKYNKSLKIEIDGVIKSIREWSECPGISIKTIDRRYKKGLRGLELLKEAKKTGPRKRI